MVPPTITEKGADTRRRITLAGTHLFLEHGYSGTSLSQILAASEVTKGGFYFHFASKAVLAIEVIETTRTQFRHDVMALTGLHDRASDQLAAMVRAVGAKKRSAPAVSALWRLCEEVCGEPEINPDRVLPYHDWIEVTSELLTRAQAEGDLDPATDPASAARFCVSAYCGMDQLADLSRTDLSESAIEEYLGFVARAIGLRMDLER